MSTTKNRPFLRIAATYPSSPDDPRRPTFLEVELDVEAGPDEEPIPDDDAEFPSSGFTRFVTDIVKTLAGDRPASVHVLTMEPRLAGALNDLLGHPDGCGCDKPEQAAEPSAEASQPDAEARPEPESRDDVTPAAEKGDA
ncbi:hypothetical protein AB0F93_00075 [Micromonospora tulbaghiae]|uniref:hypothetical protein n=1 Tax=Micromonospora tulbaghiae TaxID=479978 RepID=UPI003327DDDD